MKKITKIDPAVCRELEAAIEAALKPVAQAYGLAVTLRNGFYAPTSFKPTIEFSVISEDGMAETMEAQAFRKFATMHGLQPTDLGRTFRMKGETFTVTGLRTKARTKPITATSRGKTYIFPADTVAVYLAREARA